jgi:hypothetical protein
VQVFDFHDIVNALFGGDFQYVSAPLSQSSSLFAALGRERNGSFFPHT